MLWPGGKVPARAEPGGALALALLSSAFVAVGLALFAYAVLQDAMSGHEGRAISHFVKEMSGAVTALPLWFVVAWVRRPRTTATTSAWHGLEHAAALAGYSVLHTLVLWAVRPPLFALAGVQVTRHAPTLLDFAAQVPHDVLSYAACLGGLYLLASFQSLREREQRLARAELHALRLKLRPHFLFNALNAISSTMYEDPARADTLLSQLADLLRASLRSVDTEDLSLREEVVALRQYCALLTARFGDLLVVELDVQPGVEQQRVPSMILQPLVENAVHHGNLKDGKPGRITVRAWGEPSAVCLEVWDDGAGAPAGKDVLAAGVGLSSTVDRLRHRFGDAHRFHARNAEGGGFIVSLRLPATGDSPP
ncbi:MAG: histidine kinase [Archangiaceae bacterium]|nr:histidine kinase [Archangiaceae bacterium]